MSETGDPTEEVIRREIRRAREIIREDARRRANSPSHRVDHGNPGGGAPGDPPSPDAPPLPADGNLGKDNGNPPAPPRKPPAEGKPRRNSFWWGEPVD